MAMALKRSFMTATMFSLSACIKNTTTQWTRATAKTVARALGGRRLGLLLGQAGNRDDEAIAALAATAARFAPERVLIKELPAMLRGRQPGEVPALLARGLLAAGLPAGQCLFVADEAAAAQSLLDWAEAGDVLVLAGTHASLARAKGVLLTGSDAEEPTPGDETPRDASASDPTLRDPPTRTTT